MLVVWECISVSLVLVELERLRVQSEDEKGADEVDSMCEPYLKDELHKVNY